jgi:hypothetical protein
MDMIGVVAVVVDLILHLEMLEMVVLVEVVEVVVTTLVVLVVVEHRHLIFPILPLLDPDQHWQPLRELMVHLLQFLVVMVDLVLLIQEEEVVVLDTKLVRGDLVALV